MFEERQKEGKANINEIRGEGENARHASKNMS